MRVASDGIRGSWHKEWNMYPKRCFGVHIKQITFYLEMTNEIQFIPYNLTDNEENAQGLAQNETI